MGADGSRTDRTIIVKTAAEVAARLDSQLEAATQAIQQLLVSEITDLDGDAQLIQLMRDTVASNVDTFFSAIRNGIPVEHIEPPTAALEYARRLAQREVSADALVRAYRLGHRAALAFVLDEIRSYVSDPTLRLAVYEQMEGVSFAYIDLISQLMLATYQEERERWLGNRNTLRTLHVRELLAGGDVDVDAAAIAIRYPLRRIHVGIVVWCAESDDGGELDAMEACVHKLSKALGSQEAPLFISVDRVTAWAWIPMPSASKPDVLERIRRFVKSTPSAPSISAGNPLPDIAGFRRSHQQAEHGRSVALISGIVTDRIITPRDPGLEMAALLGDDIEAASAWITEVLGPLASDTESDERLRDTLRTFLRTGSSHKAAAEELHLHSNSVKYRVNRAVERRGRPIADDRLDVEVALLLCHWFGRAVLR
ncbi:PucR family transcriptional regulator [Mycobacterium vicinigordonae]|uniref:Helix-turn-helix domain-containing protein n=1 Tax=Mycobacterium vicinigordonae TaxID=1719132 RepID=A0A7D6IS85_9MYCO|nr:helix-turn-helix domain-containing protein [Mycobacterium vicinigordonae]QLL07539.1 helix-turn-helix domain-containing protein [Mycobacterium vicinigordonae]